MNNWARSQDYSCPWRKAFAQHLCHAAGLKAYWGICLNSICHKTETPVRNPVTNSQNRTTSCHIMPHSTVHNTTRHPLTRNTYTHHAPCTTHHAPTHHPPASWHQAPATSYQLLATTCWVTTHRTINTTISITTAITSAKHHHRRPRSRHPTITIIFFFNSCLIMLS